MRPRKPNRKQLSLRRRLPNHWVRLHAKCKSPRINLPNPRTPPTPSKLPLMPSKKQNNNSPIKSMSSKKLLSKRKRSRN